MALWTQTLHVNWTNGCVVIAVIMVCPVIAPHSGSTKQYFACDLRLRSYMCVSSFANMSISIEKL